MILKEGTIDIINYVDEPQLFTIKDIDNNLYLCLRSAEDYPDYTAIKINEKIKEDVKTENINLKDLYLKADKYYLIKYDDVTNYFKAYPLEKITEDRLPK